MSDLALRVERVGKKYRLGQLNRHPTLRETLTKAAAQSFRRLRQKGSTQPEEIWALEDVSFEVRQGEVLGIIGRNGAGKSTLLKILSRITEPTIGRVEGYGRVGSLLEVGTGFHPELTGRENIYLNGAILGMRRAEISKKFDEIVAFAEVEKFLDTPVKRYSSGMYVRLAFAVAAHLEPEILLVDEVLAVGDVAFQKKCLGKMNSVAQQGRTVLFVSHNLSRIQALCQKTIWLEAGKVKAAGKTALVVQQYLAEVMTTEAIPLEARTDRMGDGSIRLRSVRIEPVAPSGVIRTSSRLRISIDYWSDRPLKNAQFYIDVSDLDDAGIYALDSTYMDDLPEVLPAEGTVVCETDPIHLTPGRCYLNVAVFRGTAMADRVDYAAVFDVEPEDFFASGRMPERKWTKCVIRHSWSIPMSGSQRQQSGVAASAEHAPGKG